MKRMKNLSALFLAVLMAMLPMTGCGNQVQESQTDTTPADTAAIETEPAETKLTPDLPEKDYEGYSFRMMTKGLYNVHWRSIDAVAEELTGEPINDAVFNRNTYVSETYNVKFEEVIHTDMNPTPMAQKFIQAGEDGFDVLLHGNEMRTLITGGMMLDLNTIPYMDLEKPWYDQNANSALSIANRLYMTAGDMTIMDNNATWCLQFNKALADDLNLGNLYDMVKEGKWTMDVLLSAVELASQDLNGDGVHDEFDQWGIEGESFNTTALMMGAGVKIFEKDENDMPVLAIGTEHFYNTFEKAVAINGNMDFCLHVDNYTSKYPGESVWSDCMDKCFSEGRALFNFAGMNRVTLFREMETDFGILPIPKWDEEQESYHNVVSLWCAALIAVPKTAGDTERTGVILEALNAESMYTLTPAYYDITLQGKSVRDEESADMLDIIFESRVYDLGNMFAWGGVFDLPGSLTRSGADKIASQVETKKKATETDMQKTLDAILAN